MRHAAQSITLYNFYLDRATGYDACVRTQLDGVSFFMRTQSALSKDGFAAEDVATIRIPASASRSAAYLAPKAFDALADKRGYFTLREGDVIVLGSAPDEAVRRAELQNKYDSAVLILGVTDNRAGHAPHWKVTAK